MADHEEVGTIARLPTRREVLEDRAFRGLTRTFAWFTMLLVVLILGGVTWQAWPVLQRFGVAPLASAHWDASKEEFGILPEIWGTVYSSVLGVALGSLFGVAVAIFLTQDYIPPRTEVAIKNVVELLAAIPSVVYGLWGIFVVIPAIRPACEWLHGHLGWIPIFGTRLSGPGLLPAALVLAIMVLPTVSAISRDAIAAVPPKLRHQCLARTFIETKDLFHSSRFRGPRHGCCPPLDGAASERPLAMLAPTGAEPWNTSYSRRSWPRRRAWQPSVC